ncbi:MAG: hypothetical protein ACUVSA_12490 [Desulfosoma sp.]|uniref:hypothetical protein n=1 Tax=Desulfosoma sp. TaxID=2603217 RepID=UPI00404B9DB1
MGAEEFLIMVWSMTALAAEDRRFGAKKICPQSPSILDKNIRSVKKNFIGSLAAEQEAALHFNQDAVGSKVQRRTAAEAKRWKTNRSSS